MKTERERRTAEVRRRYHESEKGQAAQQRYRTKPEVKKAICLNRKKYYSEHKEKIIKAHKEKTDLKRLKENAILKNPVELDKLRARIMKELK